MFISSSELKTLKQDLRDQNTKHWELYRKMNEAVPFEFVECEKCGCLLNKRNAHKGEAEVRQETIPSVSHAVWCEKGGGSIGYKEKDVIYYPYYCKIHKPKKAK